MRIRVAGRNPPASRAHEKTLLDQERLDDVLDRTALLAHRGRETVDTHRAAVEALDDREQELAIEHVEALRIDLEA